jgi:hypothetical protein
MFWRRRFIFRLLLIVTTLNLLGIVCFCMTTQAPDPLVARGFDSMSDSSALDSIGFTLMLPGIFFAAIAFLCGRAFAWNDATARIIWYATGFAINVVGAWRAGLAAEDARKEM